MTATQALAAIRARLDGVFDHPALLLVGQLHQDTDARRDIRRILDLYDEAQKKKPPTVEDLVTMLETLVPHAAHYASMPRSSSTAYKDAADARGLLAAFQKGAAPRELCFPGQHAVRVSLDLPFLVCFKKRDPDPGVCRVRRIDWDTRQASVTNGRHTYGVSLDELVDVPVDLSDTGPYATPDDETISRELKISVLHLRFDRAVDGHR